MVTVDDIATKEQILAVHAELCAVLEGLSRQTTAPRNPDGSAALTTAGMRSKVFPLGWSSARSIQSSAGRRKKHDTARGNYITNIALPNLRLGILPEQEHLECIRFPGPAEMKGADEVCRVHCPHLSITHLPWASRNGWTRGRRCTRVTPAPSRRCRERTSMLSSCAGEVQGP